jgi:hypothetical protein
LVPTVANLKVVVVRSDYPWYEARGFYTVPTGLQEIRELRGYSRSPKFFRFQFYKLNCYAFPVNPVTHEQINFIRDNVYGKFYFEHNYTEDSYEIDVRTSLPDDVMNCRCVFYFCDIKDHTYMTLMFKGVHPTEQ